VVGGLLEDVLHGKLGIVCLFFCWYALGVWDPSIEFGGLLQLKNA